RLTTVLSAWRWAEVARGLGLRLPLGAAVADYYRALFLNAALPGGVLGDVHRAVRHGQSAGDVGRGVRAVVLERTAGQIALVALGIPVLLVLPSPVLAQTRHGAELLGLAALGGLAIVAAVRMGRSGRPSRRGRAVRAALAEARTVLFDRRTGPTVLLSSVVVLAGHLLMFLVAARAAGSDATPAELLPIALLALIAMGLPLNIGGWGPREGVMAWAFGTAGLGAGTGLAVAVVYGVLSFVASLPGIVVLVARWYGGLRRKTAAEAVDAAPAGGVAGPTRTAARSTVTAAAARSTVTAAAAHVVLNAPYPRSPPGSGRGGRFGEVTKEKYAAKDSTSSASSRCPFSAEASDGRPMTPDSV
ncbi:Lysylphosphatidylglycerol synthetase/glycosyltransferase AglD, partial [Actinobacteria bacterium OK074]